jgi:hypothetical protein
MEIMRTITDTDCPICNEVIHDIFTTSCCNQLIHKQCLDKCRKTTSIKEVCCPYCRTIQNVQNIQNVIEVITEIQIPEIENYVDYESYESYESYENHNNNNEIRFIMWCKCTICKVVIVNVFFIIVIVSWLLTYQILANKRLLKEYRCSKYPYCNITNINNITI